MLITDTFHYVSLLSTLRMLLEDDKVYQKVFCEHSTVTDSNTYNDFCDGSFFRCHPLFSIQKESLQIIAYYDELEICNALGANVKSIK